MSTFLGRKTEQEKLLQLFSSDSQMTCLMYGSRRIGKSELIKKCLEKQPVESIYYECKQTTELNNTESLTTLISEKYALPRLAFSGIEELLEYLFASSKDRLIILVLDEYPYLRDTVIGLDSIIQVLIDKYRDKCHLKIILCGSYVDTMKSLLTRPNPLFGRIDLVLDIKPMDYYDSSLFYPAFSNEDKVKLYSVFGGVPYYNRLIDSNKTVQDNIINLIASPAARLENEVKMNLYTEFSKMLNANEVFEALAKGHSKYSDILSQSHVSSSPTLAAVLDKLIAMEVIRKETPINDENNRKKAGYFISDNLSLFYYRYVFRFLSQMNIMDPQVFFVKYIKQDFEEYYVPHLFEDICGQFLIKENRAGKIDPVIEKIGKYYYDDPANKKNGEFDIVTLDSKGYIFYEAKFKNAPITDSIIRHEIEQIKQTDLNCYRIGFFSKAGFKDIKDSSVITYSLDELYK